jgi:hypothetical protein
MLPAGEHVQNYWPAALYVLVCLMDQLQQAKDKLQGDAIHALAIEMKTISCSSLQ